MAESSNVALSGSHEEEDEVINLPQVDNSHLIARFSRSLVGRLLNADGRSIEALLTVLPRPKIWDVEGRVRGIDLGNSRFQFDFNTEADLLKVLSKRPCHFNNWSFPLERWEPHVGNFFPNSMTFWISVQGIPTHFWLSEIFEEIGRKLGVVRAVDANTARVQVTVIVDEPLKFFRKARLPSGEIVKLELKYERLSRWCFNCGHISHEERTCPSLSEAQKKERRAAREAERDLSLENHEARTGSRDLSKRVFPETVTFPSRLRRASEAANNLQEDDRSSNAARGENVHVSHHVLRNAEGFNPPRREEKDRENVWKRLDPPSRVRNNRQYTDRRESKFPKIPPSRYTEAIYRKRSHEVSFAANKERVSTHKYLNLLPHLGRRRVPDSGLSKGLSPTRPQTSDSQQTLSDPPRRLQVAKQLNSSPNHQRSRPFRLNLQRKSNEMDKGKAIDMGDSVDSGSSAKKSLNFDVPLPVLGVALTTAIQENASVGFAPFDPDKSWYEMVMEEEEEEKRLSFTDNIGGGREIPVPDNDAELLAVQLEKLIEGDGEKDVQMADLDPVNEDWIVDDDLLGEDCDFNDDEFNQIDKELMLDAPQEKAPEMVDPPTAMEEGETEEQLVEVLNNEGGSVKMAMSKENSADPVSSIPTWWKGGEPTKKSYGPRRKIPSTPGLMGLASKKIQLVKGRGSPRFKVKGICSKSGPSPKAKGEKKKRHGSGSLSGTAQNRKLPDSTT
ncbi:hypothetical protein N665_0128s0015 [Sinapis alba]|nr:hypothetical protein N665_0128s0015 [Sinapis alba]